MLARLGADSGARRGELAALQVGDLDGDRLTISRGVSNEVLGPTKSSRIRRRTLGATAAHPLDFRQTRGALVATVAYRGIDLRPLSIAVGQLAQIRAGAYRTYRAGLGPTAQAWAPDGTDLPDSFTEIILDVTFLPGPSRTHSFKTFRAAAGTAILGAGPEFGLRIPLRDRGRQWPDPGRFNETALTVIFPVRTRPVPARSRPSARRNR